MSEEDKSVRKNFPDLVSEEKEDLCICGHSSRYHFSLGCSRCMCYVFITWEEVDRERSKESE